MTRQLFAVYQRELRGRLPYRRRRRLDLLRHSWLCVCGHWVEGRDRCEMCFREAPWGADDSFAEECADEDDAVFDYWFEWDMKEVAEA